MKSKKVKAVLFWLFVAAVYGVCAWFLLAPTVTDVIQVREANAALEEFEQKTEFSRAQYKKYVKEREAYKKTLPLYEQETAEIPEEIEELLPYRDLYETMLRYNESIQSRQCSELIGDVYDYAATPIDPADYGLENGVVGTLYLPGMEKTFPLYLGASLENLSKGVAQIAYSSMPTGGVGNNVVIAGHRGWNNGKFLKEIEDVKLGSVLVLTTPWEVLYYKAVEIQVINPYDVTMTLVQPGRDLLTVLTCHPYGTGGRYRYLLICERYWPEEPEETEEETARPAPSVTETENEPTSAVAPETTEYRRPDQELLQPVSGTVEFVSSKSEILIDDVAHTIGVVLLIALPILALCRRRKKSDREEKTK